MKTGTDLTAPTTRGSRRLAEIISAPAVAGIAYTAAWAAGLAVWPSNLDVAMSGAQVVAAYAGHQVVAITQYLLVEGLAAVALAGVVMALGQAARRRGAGRLGRATVAFGTGAVILSLVQCAMGMLLAGSAVPDGDAGRAGVVFDLINRMDGVKMFLLAIMAGAGVGLVRAGILPRWLGYAGALLAAALIVSGTGYLLLSSRLATAAFVSLPLLLVWVTGAGIVVGRTSR